MVFLDHTNDKAAKFSRNVLVYIEQRFDCQVHALRTDTGGEYANVDLFCKKSGVALQRNEPSQKWKGRAYAPYLYEYGMVYDFYQRFST